MFPARDRKCTAGSWAGHAKIRAGNEKLVPRRSGTAQTASTARAGGPLPRTQEDRRISGPEPWVATLRSRWAGRRGTCAAPGLGYARAVEAGWEPQSRVLSKGRNDATTKKKQVTRPEPALFRGRRKGRANGLPAIYD